MMKGFYIPKDLWVAFHELKVTGGFSSDDGTLQFILQKHKVAWMQSKSQQFTRGKYIAANCTNLLFHAEYKLHA